MFLDAFSAFRHNETVTPQRCTLLLIFALLPSLLLPTELAAKSKSAVRASSPAFDADYISALATANRFLNAWETRDHETCLLLLTGAAKHQVSEDSLHTFINATPDTRKAYEVGRGRKLKPGRYSFPVALFTLEAGPGRQRLHPRPSHIIVTRAW